MIARPSVSIQLTKTRHIVCKAHINGVACQLLIDTGASAAVFIQNYKNILSFVVKEIHLMLQGQAKEKWKLS